MTAAQKTAPASSDAIGAQSLPIVDVTALRVGDDLQKAATVAAIRSACLDKGFFYCIGHGVDPTLMRRVFEQSAAFFALLESDKLALNKDNSRANRGYEPMRGQSLEPCMLPDLKEGYYIGIDIDIDIDDERSLRHFNTGPNVWPSEMPAFQSVMLSYFDAMLSLCRVLLDGLAQSLDRPTSYFEPLHHDPLATLRLLPYPPQPANPKPGEKGCGAHTDFGGVTILMQDDVGGLQVWDHDTQGWIEGTPVAGVFVVNLGDLIGRWTDDLYRSTIHRVINQSGQERYSVPFFFAGNPDHIVECIPICLGPRETPKYRPVTFDAQMRQ